MLSVFRFSQNLGAYPPCIYIVVVARFFHISCIKNIHFVILNKGGTGIYAAGVLGDIRSQDRFPVFPMEHIPADTVPPVSSPSVDVQRRVLEICLELPLKLTQAVGIIDPSYRRHDMIFCPERTVCHCPSHFFFCFSCFLKTIFHSCPSYSVMTAILSPADTVLSASLSIWVPSRGSVKIRQAAVS